MVLAVPTQDTFTVGEILTAALMNKNVRDAVGFLTAPPIAVLSQSAAQSIPAGAFTPVNFDASAIDTYGGHSNSVNNSRYTAQVAGWYLALGRFGFATTTNRLGGYWGVNGTSSTGNSIFTAASANGVTGVLVGDLLNLNVGDYAQIICWQNATAGASNVVNVNANLLWVHS